MSDATRRAQTPTEDIKELFRRVRNLEHKVPTNLVPGQVLFIPMGDTDKYPLGSGYRLMVDNAENLYLQISTDGGSAWTTRFRLNDEGGLLAYNHNGDEYLQIASDDQMTGMDGEPIYPTVESGRTSSGSQTTLSAPETFDPVLSKTFSGLDSARTYQVRAWAQCTTRIVVSGTDHKYQVRLNGDGSAGTGGLTDHGEAAAALEWQNVAVYGQWTFTGKTSFDLDLEAYSYDTSNAGRVYFRDMVYDLRLIS